MSNQLQAQQMQKLIFIAGNGKSDARGQEAENLLHPDALNVCRLLAIIPEDIVERDINQFQERGLSQQRLQLRFEYYEEKRLLKLKAIENVLIKCQTSKNGQPTPEAQQVLALLDDMKVNKQLFGSKVSTGKNGFFSMKGSSPHGLSNRRPFMDTAKQAFNSGVNYQQIQYSPPSVKSIRVLNNLPKNLYSQEGQEEMKKTLSKQFVKTHQMFDQRGNSVPNTSLTTFDTYTHGFDLPASVQLNRMNRKLHKWEKAQDLIEQKKTERELISKSILKKREKVENRLKKAKADEKRLFLDKLEEKKEKQVEKAQKMKQTQTLNQKEISQNVKEYYKEIKEFDITRAERQQKIEEKMKETYDAYCGGRAAELEKKINRAMDDIEQGQELAQELNDKLIQRKVLAAEALKKKAEDVRNLGQRHGTDTKRFVAQDIVENKVYRNLEHVVKTDQNAAKSIKRQQRQIKHDLDEKRDSNAVKEAKLKEHKRKARIDQQEQLTEYADRQAAKDKEIKRMKEEQLQIQQQTAERRKLHERDAKENQKRINTLKSIRAYKILEKHAFKDQMISEYSKSAGASKFF